MSAIIKLSREVRRILSERLTLLFMALTAAGIVWFSLNGAGRTASDAFIINAAKNSAFLGALFFALLTLVQFHRDFKNNTDIIVLTSTDPVHHQVRRTLSLICVAAITTLLISLFTLPYAINKTGDYFQFATFASAWGLIFLGTLIFSVLLTSGLYMLTKRVEAAFIIMAGLILLSKLLEGMNSLNPSYLFYWVQTTSGTFSDLVPNQIQIDMLIWNRIFCLCVSLGLWSLGLCSFRRYRRGLFGSFSVNCRRVWIPVLLVVSLLLSGAGYAFEPIFDDSKPIDLSGLMSSGTGIVSSLGGEQEVGNPNLTLTEKTFNLDISTKGRTLSGTTKFKVLNANSKAQSLPLMMNTGMKIDRVLINGVEGKAIRGETGQLSVKKWSIELPASAEYEIEISYSGCPMNNNTFIQNVKYGISDGYVWVPAMSISPDLDINKSKDIAFSGTLLLDEKLEPVFAKGEKEKGQTINGKTKWKYLGDAGSKGIDVIAAEYMTRAFEAGGLNIEFKYFKKHDKSVTDMGAVNVIKAAIDYFTEVYGPLVYDKKLTMLELPAHVSGGIAGGNMSAWDETNYNPKGYVPADAISRESGGGIDVLVHEIAHQWWGLATMPMQDGASNWSAEGITCYSTYCFMKQYFGEEYATKHFVKEWQRNWEAYKNAFYIQHPEYLAKLSGKDASSIMNSFVQINLYDTMSLMLLKGEKALGGREAFQQKLSELYMKNFGQPITYDKFLAVTGLTKEALTLE